LRGPERGGDRGKGNRTGQGAKKKRSDNKGRARRTPFSTRKGRSRKKNVWGAGRGRKKRETQKEEEKKRLARSAQFIRAKLVVQENDPKKTKKKEIAKLPRRGPGWGGERGKETGDQ